MSQLLISRVIIPQFMFSEPIYIPRALNTGTCIRQGDLFYSAGLHRNRVLATANTGKIWRGSERVEVRKEEIHGSKRSMYGYTMAYSKL